MPKAIALYSGGLDSTLAILQMKRYGVDVTAITFLNHFGCDISDRSSCSKDPFAASVKFDFQVKLSHLSDKFLEIVKNPKFGHGKNMNPCVDCRILMLKEAKQMMELLGADFLITGEVLGQRPMSQRKDCFPLIDREAGVDGLVVRPLTGRLLKAAIPEQKGIIKREWLLDFRGRSRKPQMALADELGLTEYPSPAGGCLLTDPVYSYRLRDLLDSNSDPDFREINFLRVGRHFRLSPDTKIVVGRTKEENEIIKTLLSPGDPVIRVLGYGSPLTVILGKVTEEAIYVAASLCARYSGGRHLPELDVLLTMAEEQRQFRVRPADEEDLQQLRIEKKQPSRVSTVLTA
jgi:tRNA U34 2-thiouridine synthase MnmA/TrmU